LVATDVTLSVVITVTTYNDAERIESCIQSCLRQHGLARVTLVVADDGSTDATLAILQRLAAQVDNLHILALLHGERGRARAAAIEKALTLAPDFLLFIDSDMTLEEGLVQRCVDYAHQQHYGALVVPENAFSTSTNFFTRVKVFERNIINNAGAAYNGAHSIEAARFWRTAAYLRSGGFHPAQIAFEETQPTLRYLAQGGKVARATFTAIDHDEKQVTLRSLLAKKRYYFSKMPLTVETEVDGFKKMWQRWFFFRPVLYRPANLYRYLRQPHLALGMIAMYLLLTGVAIAEYAKPHWSALLMLRSVSWERRHPAGLPPEMAARPVRNMSALFRLPAVGKRHLPPWMQNRLLPYLVILLAIVTIIHPIYAPGQLVFSDLAFGTSSDSYLDEIYGLWNRRWSTPNLFNVPRLLYVTPFVGLAALFAHDGAVLLKSLLTAILLVAGVSYYTFAQILFQCYFHQRKTAFTTTLLTLSAIFYAINPWVIFRIQHIFLLCGYALFPLVIYYYLRVFYPEFARTPREGANRILPDRATLADLLLFCVCFTVSVAALHYLLFIPLVILALQSFVMLSEFLLCYRRQIPLRPYLVNTLMRGMWVSIILTFLSFYWVVTYGGSILVGARPDQFNINTPETVHMFSQHSSLPYVALGISYWWPMLDLNTLPLSFYIGGGLLLSLAALALLRVNWVTLLIGCTAALLVVLATGTYYPPLAETYLALVFQSFFPVNNLLRDPNKLIALYLLLLPLLMTVGAHNVVALIRQHRWRYRVGLLVVAAMISSYWVYLAPFHAAFLRGYYAPTTVPAAYQAAGEFLATHLRPTERAIYLPLSSSMINRATGVTAPFWNRIDGAGHDLERATERATGDFQVYDSPVDTLYQYEGNPPTIAHYYTYVQYLLDRGRTSHLAELLNPLGGRLLAYRDEYPAHDKRQQLNRDLLALQAGLMPQFTNDIFTIYANDRAAPLTRVVPQVIFTPYGYGRFERYASFPAFSFDHLGALFTTTAIDRPIADIIRPQDYLEVAQADDLLLSMLPAANYIVPFDQVNEGNPFLKWSKTFLGSEEWLWYMKHYGIDNYPFDFDFGRGVLFTTAAGRLDVPVYRINQVQGDPILQLSDLVDTADFFVADNPDTLNVTVERTERVDALPLLQGRVQDGPSPFLWQVARTRLVPIQPGHPYRLSTVVSGINTTALHFKIKFFDKQLAELGVAYLARSDASATFDETQLAAEMMTPAGAAFMEINVLSRQDPALTAIWQIHQLALEDLGAYGRENRVSFTYTVEKSTTATLYARVFFNRAGGKLKVEVAGQAVAIDTADADINQFRWVKLGVFTFQPGANNLAVTNLRGFNALNLLASVPQAQHERLTDQMATLLRDSHVFLTLDAEEDFAYQGHRQPTQAYPLLTSGSAIRSQDGQLTAEFDIVKEGRYTLFVRHSDLPAHGSLALTLTNATTAERLLQHRIERRPEQIRTSQVAIAAVHEDRLGQRYLTTENDPLLANLTQTELPGLNLPPGRYRLTLTFHSNAPLLAETAALRPASTNEQITVTYKEQTLWGHYTAKPTPAQQNRAEQTDARPCTEVELATVWHDNQIEQERKIPSVQGHWQTLTVDAIPVLPNTPYLVELAVRSVNLLDRHVKLIFFDQDQREICVDYTVDRLARYRYGRFHDAKSQQLYAEAIDAAEADWQWLEKVVNAPANARTMVFQLLARVDESTPSNADGRTTVLPEGQLAVKEFRILAFKDLVAVDLTALYEETTPAFFAALAQPADLDAVDLDSMTTRITLTANGAQSRSPTNIALHYGESPSNLWRLYTPDGVFTPWSMNGTQSAFFFPPTPTATAKIILADAYKLGIILLVGGLIVSAGCIVVIRVKTSSASKRNYQPHP